MNYCLIEHWSQTCSLPQGAKAVALIPEAIFQLQQAKINYITLEDFYTSGEIRGDTDEFLQKQLLWFRDFDDFLQNLFPEAKAMNLELASIYYYRLKYRLDSVIISARILERFINQVRPEKIYFFSQHFKEDKIDSTLSFRASESINSRLIESVCKKYQIDFQRLIADKPRYSRISKIFKSILKGRLDLGELKQLVKKVVPKAVLNLHSNYIESQPVSSFLEETKQFLVDKGRILFLNRRNYMYDFCFDLRKYGFKIIFQSRREENAKAKKIKINQPLDWSKVLTEFRQGKIMQWVNEQSGFDASDALMSRFEFFLKEICPQIIAKTKAYLELYQKKRIDFVAIHIVWGIDDYAALAAVGLSSTTRSIGFAHGADAYKAESKYWQLFRKFDFYFLFTKKEVEHQKDIIKSFRSLRPQVYEFPYFSRRYQRNLSKKQPFKNKPIMIFVPVIGSPRPNRPICLYQAFPMEYVKWHQALAEYLSRRDDYYFIWKGLFQLNSRFDLMAEVIREKGYKNIQFNSGLFTFWLPKADRVLFDTPSTAFFEGIFSRLPVLSLFRPDVQLLRENAYQAFGPSLRAYSNITEGIKIVEEFLDNKKDKYLVPFVSQTISLPEVFAKPREKEAIWI